MLWNSYTEYESSLYLKVYIIYISMEFSAVAIATCVPYGKKLTVKNFGSKKLQ